MSTLPLSQLSLAERLRQKDTFGAAWQLMCAMRVAVPAIVVEFFPETQTITAQVAITEFIYQNLVPTATPIPLLYNVPIITLRAGGASGMVITVPVIAGDECLLIFGDNDYSAWWENGAPLDSDGNYTPQQQQDKRRHDLSDSFAIVGLWSQPNVLSDYDTANLQIRTVDGTQAITVKPNEIDIVGTTVTISGSSAVEIEGGAVTVSNSSVNLENNVTIQGRAFLTHTHSGVSTGSGDTGPVV